MLLSGCIRSYSKECCKEADEDRRYRAKQEIILMLVTCYCHVCSHYDCSARVLV